MADNQTTTGDAGTNYRDIVYVDYKDVDFLKRFLNEQGMLLPRRVTGVPSPVQRQLTRAVKRARHLALLPYAADTVR
jgi:small subunit ribosomal protein S18